MQIITKILTNFNTLTEITFYGPNEIPVNHKLYGRNLYRHGTYTRGLILPNGITVTFVIFRFCEKTPEGYKTYSLLPFFISSYQRYINIIIDVVLKHYFIENKSMFSIANELDINLPTIRKWIKKFADKVDELDNAAEQNIINSKPGHRAAAYPTPDISSVVKSLFRKINRLVRDESSVTDYGVTSWINLMLKPFLGKLNNILEYA